MNKGISEGRTSLEDLCVNTLRTIAMDAVQKANSGHPGAPMGLAPSAYVLWTEILKHNPKDPHWVDRDRFVLSGGHASVLLYGLLHLTGYDLDIDDIKNFRQWESKTPGHPEYGLVPGVETTTGPLGQGFTNAVGMALAERHLASVYNRTENEIVDHYTYVMCGDGDMMEGVTSEAASFAGHTGLSRLICIYDDNKISIEGSTDIAFTEDVAGRFKAYNWHVSIVEDGNDTGAIKKALQEAKKEKEKPSIILLRTHIAFGSPNKQDSASAHGEPLGEEEILLTKKNLGWPEDSAFSIPEQVLDYFRGCVKKGEKDQGLWMERFERYRDSYPDLADRWTRSMEGVLEERWDADIPEFIDTDGPMATRAASGKVLNAIADNLPTLIGGSADLAPSNKTLIESSHDFQKGNYDGRNIRFGVREHSMGGIISGILLHKGLIPYGGTFLVFADYMRPSIRLAGLMELPVIYVFTHDSIAVGEDGPTHQPVEHLASLRVIPGLTVIRPADASETAEAWRQAITSNMPVALILSRQKLPVLDRSKFSPAEGLAKGAYILMDTDGTPDIILVATGSEVHITIEAAEMLAQKDLSVRVVSMPSVELFEKNPQDYKDRVLPPDVTSRLIVEAGHPMGWDRYSGVEGAVIGINHFGASAPGGTVMEKFGFTAANIVAKAMEVINKSGSSPN